MKGIINCITDNRWMAMICLSFLIHHFSFSEAQAASRYDNPDTIVVARDGTGEFRTVDEAIEVCRAFMDYHKVIFVKNGTYKGHLDRDCQRTKACRGIGFGSHCSISKVL